MIDELSFIAYGALRTLRLASPIDTGNLRYEAIRLVRHTENEYLIVVNAEIAPYAVYTNESWVSPKWEGKQNPNEHWIDNAVRAIVRNIIAAYEGTLDVVGENERYQNKSFWDSENGKKLRDQHSNS